MWVAGKASYKLGAIIEHGGELVIYAPHLKGISTTHGRLIEKYGYAPLEQVREMVEGSDELRANLCVAAHLAHVSYAGRLGADGKIAPRYRITLASGAANGSATSVGIVETIPSSPFAVVAKTDDSGAILQNDPAH